MKKGIRLFSDASIKTKLFFTYLLVLSVSALLFISVNSYITANDTEKQARTSLEIILQQSGSFINYKASSVQKVVDIMVIHDTIQSLVFKDAKVYEENIGTWLLDEYYFNQLIYNVQTNPDIQHITLYMQDGMAAVQSTDQFQRLADAKEEPWLKRVNDSSSFSIWIPSKVIYDSSELTNATVSFIRKIPAPYSNRRYAGLLRAEMPTTTLKQILDQALYTKSTTALLLNSHQEIITSSSQLPVVEPEQIMNALQASSNDNYAAPNPMIIQGIKMLVGSIPIEHTDWQLILAVPYSDIVEMSSQARNQLLLIFLLAAILTLPFAYWVAASGTSRIRKLTKTMRKVGVGNIRTRLDPQNSDEIGELTMTFNRMLSRIDDLAADKYELGLEVKNLELKALQAQINPHFLYNTLDMANWLAMKYNADDIRLLITSLSGFYKLSLSNGEDFIPIRSEIDQVAAYVRIQNMRFRNNIQLLIDVPDDIKNLFTLKLILQPLVENAILHGIMEKEDQKGTISIKGEFSGAAIRLIVEDDGIGISEETLSKIMSRTQSKAKEGYTSGGYGMKNIHHRLEITYGPPYGLTVHSQEGVGTKVIVTIPCQPEAN